MKNGKSLLIAGRIPEHTECPFANECPIKHKGDCKHLGIQHPTAFSCASARGFDTLQQMSKK